MQREQQVRAFEGRMLELSATACYTVGQLAVNGASLMDAGITPGPAVGKALNTLLRAVMERRLPNEKAALLAALEKADGLALGSPVYFGNVTGAMRSFQERLCFPYLVYDRRRSTIAPRRLAMACIYTMNVDAETMRQHGYPETLAVMDGYLGRIFSTPSVLYVTDTWQFDDYARYVADRFSEADKRRRREEQFPQECRQAFVMGQEMVQKLAGQGA